MAAKMDPEIDPKTNSKWTQWTLKLTLNGRYMDTKMDPNIDPKLTLNGH